MAEIFLSYAREDREVAQRLAQALEVRGWSVWWDPQIQTGRRFHQVIERELAAARCVVALWSTAANVSHWVREEAQDGLDRDILVPTKIDGIVPPLGFRTLQTADLSDWMGNEDAQLLVPLMEDIALLLSGLAGQSASAAPSPGAFAPTSPRGRGFSSPRPLAGEGGASAPGEGAAAPKPEPKSGVYIGVDPRTLPDLAVFKDIDAPWCPEMVIIPAGSFLMGSEDEDGRSDWEGPQHSVIIKKRFALGRHALTLGEYRRFVAVTGHDHSRGMCVWTSGESKPDPAKSWEDPGFAQDDRHPVVGVSWRDASAFVKWLSGETNQPYRLPTEAEWEYACRAGTTTPFSFGATIGPNQVNHDGGDVYGKGGKGRFREKTVAVGSLPANPWGLHEMHGNAWEWAEDIWHDSYNGAPDDGSPWLDGEGEDSDRDRVLRGGSWFSHSRRCRSACRSRPVPAFHNLLGFRPARTLS
jgi:Uncharacterized conserved protein